MAVKPKLALIPSGVKASKVYSVLPSDGTGDFDFSRSGNATRINKDGLIETVASNVPRLNYPLIDGVVQGCPSLLLEPSRTNLVTYSEDFTQGWTESNSTVTSNQIISPDGTLNADKLTKSDTNGSIIKGYTFVGGEVFSIFAKADESNILTIDNGDGRSYFDLINGTYNAATGGGYIEHYGNGWYRCTVKNSYVGASTIRVYPSDSLTSLSGTTGSLYIWGAQLEASSFSTSYIPNFGTALGVTRSAETCNNSGDVNTFNDSEGVLMIEGRINNDDGTPNNITLGDGTFSTNRLMFLFSNGVANRVTARFDSSGSDVTLNADGYDLTINHKIVLKYKANDIAIWVDGFEVNSGNSFSVPTTLNRIDFYNPFNSGQDNFYGNTKQIQYFDTALTDTDLEELTSWTSFNEMAQSQLYKTY